MTGRWYKKDTNSNNDDDTDNIVGGKFIEQNTCAQITVKEGRGNSALSAKENFRVLEIFTKYDGKWYISDSKGNKQHWRWATEPNNREKASFLRENIIPIQEAGHLNFVEKEGDLFNNFNCFFVNGHIEAQMIPHITYKEKTIGFAAGLLPSSGHIPLSYVMSYDTKPLVTLGEK